MPQTNQTKRNKKSPAAFHCEAYAPIHIYRRYHLGNIPKAQFCKMFNHEMNPDVRMHSMRLLRMENLKNIVLSDRDKKLLISFINRHAPQLKLEDDALDLVRLEHIPPDLQAGDI